MAWREFLRGKRNRRDVQKFSLYLIDNILTLHRELAGKTYRHGGYHAFKINDPKPRDIHKAGVRDRLLHHAIYRILYPYFDRKFVFDSFSCRIDKGTHRAMDRFRSFARKISKNNTRTTWILKCDIKKFFASINHDVLKGIIAEHIYDQGTLWLLNQIISSFRTERKHGVGLPLGNVTSQLLVNIYMNPFDQFVKRKLKIGYYIRFADDFVILSENRNTLQNILSKISEFLEIKLKLALNSDKIFIKTFTSGVDFLGWVHFPWHRVIRTSTKKRIIKNLKGNTNEHSIQSYQGVLEHGNTFNLRDRLGI